MLLTWHNLHFYQDLMAEMRAAIAQGTFQAWQARVRRRLDVTGRLTMIAASPPTLSGRPAGA